MTTFDRRSFKYKYLFNPKYSHPPSLMAEIINQDPEANPRLRQIYDILLLAGYFRIRINSLKAFDKVIGGLAWCITCSNFDIDVEYNDEMQIGQKIKVSEKICDALKKMRCPYNIQPFQLQGLDLNSIYPLVQWLVKFVYQTREYRQKFNTQLSNFLATPIIRIPKDNKLSGAELGLDAKRATKNAHIKSTPLSDPLRVYSTLIEFGDVTAVTTYSKLCALLTGKVANPQIVTGGKTKGKTQQSTNSESKKEATLGNFLFETGALAGSKEWKDAEKIIQDINKQEKNKFTKLQRRMSFSGAQLEKLVNQNRDRIEQAIKSNKREQQEESPEMQLAAMIKRENEAFESQKQIMMAKIQSLERTEAAMLARYEQAEEKAKEATEKAQEQQQMLDQILEIQKNAEEEIAAKNKMSQSKTKELEKMVEERAKLRAEKQELKKATKTKLQQLKKLKVKAEQNVPEIDEEVFNKMVAESKLKKKIYDEKFMELAALNQELAIIQRKAENVTSAPEIAQYTQRLLELIQSINMQIQVKRDLYERLNQQESIRLMINNYVDLMRTFKENYAQYKSKDEKKEFIQNLKEAYKGLEANLSNIQALLKKLSDSKNRNYEEYLSLVKLERQYFNALKQLKVQYEIAEAQGLAES